MQNGYFQLVNAGAGYGLKIVAPSDGGETVRLNEVTDYLTYRNQFCDLSVLRREVEKGETTIIMLGSGSCPVEAASISVHVTEDNMKAVVRVIPPSETGPKVSYFDVMDELKHRQIAYGIRESNIRKALENNQYCTDIIAAEGLKPRHGTDATIKYFFNTDPKAKPTQNEDGSVDFFHLNTISHCQKGDLLAKLEPGDPGEYGVNILGARIKPRDIKKAVLKYGHNIAISEDKTELTSLVNGHVTLVEDKVFVSDVFEVENVDTSTGNIDYAGSVQINGNVQSNFSVKTQGNIIVEGVVEGAYLEAGGDIIIARGMNGMGKGTLKAGGNIVVKFLENATVSAGGYVHADAIVLSTVLAGDEVTVEGKRGYIAGGRVCATEKIQTKYLGSEMGVSTVAEVGVDPTVKSRFSQVQKEIAEVAKDLQSVEPVIMTYLQKKKQGIQFTIQQAQYFKSLVETREDRKAKLERLSEEMKNLQVLLERQANAQIVVTGEVYPGVKIAIGEVSMAVQSSMKYCKFVKIRGDVKMVGI